MAAIAARSSGSLPDVRVRSRLAIGDRAILLNMELDHNNALIAEASRFWDHGIPIALYGGEKALKVIAEIDAIGGRKHFQIATQIAGACSSAAILPSRSASRNIAEAAIESTAAF